MPDQFDGLVDNLSSEYGITRRNACQRPGKLGDARAVEPLIAAPGDDDWCVHQAARVALGAIGLAAVPEITGALIEELDVQRDARSRWGERGSDEHWRGCGLAVRALSSCCIPAVRDSRRSPDFTAVIRALNDAMPQFRGSLRRQSEVPCEVRDPLRELVQELEPVLTEINESVGRLLGPAEEPGVAEETTGPQPVLPAEEE